MTEPTESPSQPVRAKAVLVDPATMRVAWMNEAATESAGEPAETVALEQAITLAQQMGVLDALREVAETGEARHLRASLVSTAQGTLTVVTSVYRLPGGMLLVLTDNDFEQKRSSAAEGASRRPGRRTR